MELEKIVLEQWSVERINQSYSFKQKAFISKNFEYPQYGACWCFFCRLLGGDLVEMLACLWLRLLALFVRQEGYEIKI